MVIYDTVLIRYGELSTKGKNRNLFIKKLLQNIKNSLSDLSKLEYKSTYDRIYIKINNEDVNIIEDRLKKVFGISSFSFTVKILSDLDLISDTCFEIAKEENLKTFKVICKRHDKSFSHISDSVNRNVASNILKNTQYKVDVHNPDLKLQIEIHEDYTYITSKKIEGAKGYPTGINGKVLLMLSGGIDSPVAAYQIMKRGIEVEAIHFASPPYTSKQSLDKVIELSKILSVYQGKIKLHIVNFTQMQMEIYAKCHNSYAITIMRRMMFRLANKIALDNNCLAIATGESLGQVASQTLESMYVINSVCDIPVIRPLITFDKLEIIEISNKIKTYETSIIPFEDCCTIFKPKNPVTKPKLSKAIYEENRFDYNYFIEKSLEDISVNIITKKEDINYL